MAVATSAGATSVTPLTTAGLSGSEGSAATRSQSTRSADCACAGEGANTKVTTANAKQYSQYLMREGCVAPPANSRLKPGFAQHRRDLGRSQIGEQRIGLTGVLRRCHAAACEDRRRLQAERDRTDQLDASDLLQF